MHYASHILLQCIALWCTINSGNTARNSVSPEILANFAKNVASVLSPAILGELQSRSNRSSFEAVLGATVPARDDDLTLSSAIDNIVDKTTNTASYYQPHAYPYNGLYEGGSPAEPQQGSQATEKFQGSLADKSFRRQERLSFYEPYDFSTNSGNFVATQKSTASPHVGSAIANIDESSTNQFSSYHGVGFHKAALAPEPYAGFPGFGAYGHFPGHHHGHHHRPYGDGGNGDDQPPPPSDDGGGPQENARLENNDRNNYGGYGYGSPYFGNPFPHGGYGPPHGPFYGPNNGNGNNSSANGRNGYGYGPYPGPIGGPYGDFYGPPGYGYGYGNGNRNGNNNGNNGSSGQTDGSAENDDQNNSTKNGYPRPYGPPLIKPILGSFHPHGIPSPFNLLPYDHFHGAFKGGPVVGVGHVGYPVFADPFLIGFPFHFPYGPIFHGKKYLPPKGKPADSGESGESGGEMTQAPTPAGELAENGNPERIRMLSSQVVAPPRKSTKSKN